jgi:hypothetical protein
MGLHSRPRSHGWHEDLRRRGLVAQRTVWAHGVVVAPPALDDDLCFGERVEDLAIEQFIPQSGVE